MWRATSNVLWKHYESLTFFLFECLKFKDQIVLLTITTETKPRLWNFQFSKDREASILWPTQLVKKCQCMTGKLHIMNTVWCFILRQLPTVCSEAYGCIWICKPMQSSVTAVVDFLADDFLPTLMSHMVQILQTSLDITSLTIFLIKKSLIKSWPFMGCLFLWRHTWEVTIFLNLWLTVCVCVNEKVLGYGRSTNTVEDDDYH